MSFLNLRMVSAGPSIAKRRHDGVDARAVRQAGVADRRGFIDPAADLADDALADIQELLIVAEADRGFLNLAGDFDVNRARAVHHDIGDVVAGEQRLERPVAEDVVADVVEQVLLLGDRHHDVLDRDDLVDDVANLLARRVGVELGQLAEIDRLDQRAEDRTLDLVVGFRAARIDGGGDLLRRRTRSGRLRLRRRPDDRRAEAGGGKRRAAGFGGCFAAFSRRRRRRRARARRLPFHDGGIGTTRKRTLAKHLTQLRQRLCLPPQQLLDHRRNET